MFQWVMHLKQIKAFPFLLVFLLLCLTVAVQAQEVGGDLTGGSGIFRPKNPEAKRSTNTNKPDPGKPTRPVRPTLSAAEIEEKFEDALSDGNDARDERKFAQAENYYRAANKLKPRDPRALQGLGNVFVDQLRWDDAETAYRQALDISLTNPDALMALSFVLVQPRTGGMNAKRFADAESFARRATQLQPTNAVAFDRLGVAMAIRGMLTGDTEAAFRKAIELDPNFVVAQVHLAILLRKMNRAAEADPLYKSAIEQAKDAPTLVLIADGMQSEQRWSDSEPILRRALELDPKNPGALFLMGRWLSVTRKYDQAEPYLKSAVELNPRSFMVRNILGRCYLGLQRYDDAFTTYQGAVGLASDADRKQLAGLFGFGGVGDGYMNAGRPKDAMRAYQQALQLDPSNAELQAKLDAAKTKATP